MGTILNHIDYRLLLLLLCYLWTTVALAVNILFMNGGRKVSFVGWLWILAWPGLVVHQAVGLTFIWFSLGDNDAE